MKISTFTKLYALVAPGLLSSLAGVQAGSFTSDFNSGLTAGSSTYSNAVVLPSGGYTNSGFCLLTTNAPSAIGSFVITNDLDAGIPVVSFTATLKVLLAAGARYDYADGMCFAFMPASDVPVGGCPPAGTPIEDGVGGGLSVGIRTCKGCPNEPTITVKGDITTQPSVYVPHLLTGAFVDLVVQLNPDNTISVSYDGHYIYQNVPLGWAPVAGSLFWIGARNGGFHETCGIDNLSIVTLTNNSPFISSFAPQGREVAANSSIDVVLADYTTAVKTNSIVLKLDGGTVAPVITQDGSGHTTLHFTPAGSLALGSRHAVSLSFTDNATPSPQTQTFAWGFTVIPELPPTGFVTVWSDGFESYNQGYLDKNLVGDPNYAPNGSGNPWFGPLPENYNVAGTTTVMTMYGTNATVMPHTGTNMIVRAFNFPSIWVNLAYRANGGWPINGNCQLDWWLYDLNERTNGWLEFGALYFYGNDTNNPGTSQYSYPFTTDWEPGWDPAGLFFWLPSYYVYNWEDAFGSVMIGGAGRYNDTGGGYYDSGKYQARIENLPPYNGGAGDAPFPIGSIYGSDGMVNTIDRSQGWHHNRITLGPLHSDGTERIWFYIDDMVNPVYSGVTDLAAKGINLLEIDSGGDTSTSSGTAQSFYDDFSFALVPPPKLFVNFGPGSNVTLTWAGEGFTLQSAPSVNGPWADISGASSGYNYNTVSGPQQFFRLRN
jgi:hypothetical protein